ncbi:hypothetical protein V8B97DRAFT_1918994 [Scleroderma yunnanense]
MSTATSNKSPLSLNETLGVCLAEGVAKDVRAHEHARHRAKERREHVQAKERKEKVAVLKAFGMKLSSHGHGAKPVRKSRAESWDGDVPEVPLPSKSSSLLQPLAPLRTSTGSFTELTLGDLISVPFPKKAKKLDFEVIPPVRAVIALDDATYDVEPDEPWEYITGTGLDDQLPQKERSYAQAAAAAIATQ